jgi:hypothetical protein
MAPQNRKNIHSSFEHCLHEVLLSRVEVEKTINAEPEGEKPHPDISNVETQGQKRRTLN